MSMDVHITLTDADLARFVEAMKVRKTPPNAVDMTTTVAEVRKVLHAIKMGDLPEFITTRLKSVETMLAMLEDKGFGLPEENRANVLTALAYFVTADDEIPDSLPIIGFLDDAIIIELCTRDLAPALARYGSVLTVYAAPGRQLRFRARDATVPLEAFLGPADPLRRTSRRRSRRS